MSDLSKREVREAVREALANAHIPSENKIRKIVQEEFQRQKELEEQEEKKGVLDEIGKFTSNQNKWKRIGRYALLFLLVGFSSISMTVLSNMAGALSQIFSVEFKGKIIYILLLLFIWALSTFVILFTLLLYDKMKKENHKYVKVIFIAMILLWLQIVDPDLSGILQSIL